MLLQHMGLPAFYCSDKLSETDKQSSNCRKKKQHSMSFFAVAKNGM